MNNFSIIGKPGNKPATLAMGKAMRNELSGYISKDPVFIRAISTVESASSKYDGLAKLYASRDTEMSREANSRKYKTHYDAAVKDVFELTLSTLDMLKAHKNDVVRNAEAALGLHDTMTHAEQSEFRAAFRAMSPKEREQALAKAVDNGDARALMSLRNQSPTLTGDIKSDVNFLIEQMVIRKNPELVQDLDAIDYAMTMTKNAHEGFEGGADAMRDPIGEERAAHQDREHQEALLMLSIKTEPA
jgi:hypothetical protein